MTLKYFLEKVYFVVMTEQFDRLINKAIEFQKAGNLAQARSMYLEAIQIEPNNYQLYKMLSSLEYQSRNFDKSLKYIDEAIKIKKNSSELYSIKGFYLYVINKEQESKELFEKALKLNASNIDALLNLGVIFKESGEILKAIDCFDKIISLDSKNYKALVNRAYIKIDTKNYQDALKDINKVLSLNKKYFNGYLMRGNIYKELKNFDKSLNDFEFLINSKKDCEDQIYNEAKFNKSLVDLLLGNFKEGWVNYEFRSKVNKRFIPDNAKKIPLLKSINECKNKSVLVISEQGIGDNIQFSRYLILLKKKCSKLSFFVNKKIKPFFEKLDIVDKVYLHEDKIDYYDFRIDLMSLPYLFNTDQSNVPEVNFSIQADKDKLVQWQKKIEKYRNFYKIGINSISNKNLRDFPLDIFKNICKFKKIKLFNLQKNISDQDFHQKKIEVLSFDDFDKYELFQDSKALIENLDLVITCDTSIAHLAASMQKPTWVLLNDVPEWRWLLNTSKSPWYKKALILRCEKKDDWFQPKNQIENLLNKYK